MNLTAQSTRTRLLPVLPILGAGRSRAERLRIRSVHPPRRAVRSAALLLAVLAGLAAAASLLGAAPPAGQGAPPATTPRPTGTAATPQPAPPPVHVLEGPPAPLPEVTLERLTEARDRAAERGDLDEEAKRRLIELYERALQHLAAARQYEERLRLHAERRAEAPGTLEQVRAELAQPPATAIDVPEGATLAELRRLRDDAEANLRLGQDRLAELERENAVRTERRAQIPGELAAARSELEEVESRLAAMSLAGVVGELGIAEGDELVARQRALTTLIEALRAEQSTDEARAELEPLRRERAQRRITAREAVLREWRTAVDRRVAADAEADAAAARAALEAAPPEVRAIAERALDFVRRRSGEDGLIARNAAARDHLARVESQLRTIATAYERDRERATFGGNVGLNSARMRAQYAALPAMSFLRSGQNRLRAALAETQLELAELELERSSLPPPSIRRDQLVATLSETVSPDVLAALRDELGGRLVEERAGLDALVEAYQEREEWLLRIQEALDPLVALTRVYGDFISARILWIRSMPPIGLGDIRDVGRSAASLLRGSTWTVLGQRFVESLGSNSLPAAGIALLFGAWLFRRRAIQRTLDGIAARVAKVHTDRFGLTIAAAGITIGEALIAPSIVWWLSAQLLPPTEAGAATPPFPDGAADGLARVAWVLLTLSLLRGLVRPSGLAAAHFRWSPAKILLIRRQLRWFTPAVLPLSFIIGATTWSSREAGDDPLGRLAFLIAAILVAVLGGKLLRGVDGVLAGLAAAEPGRPGQANPQAERGWIARFQWLIRAAVVILPASLGLLAALGWFATALQFGENILATILLVLGAIVAHGLVLRWLYVARRRLAMEEARKRRAAMLAEPEEQGQVASAEGDTVQIEEPRIDLSAIDAQTRTLLHTALTIGLVLGVLGVWAQTLPAFGMFDRVELWPRFLAIREADAVPPAVAEILGPHAARLLGTEAGRPAPQAAGDASQARAQGTPGAQGSSPARGTPEVSPPSASGTPGLAFPIPGVPPASTAPEQASAATGGVVTLRNVVVSMIAIVITVVLARNIPGLLEIAMLQRFPIEPSVRYAITAISRYVISVVGTVVAFGAIGIGWSQVQWLVAAITVGVGFGLQEIVANLVSGVIILFEQPIRVGDTVTVGNVSGTVTRIRMRATTITDWDRKELIIPNKEFITGQVINWTLSDSTLRVVIPVGVAYGSDVAKVEKLLVDVARANPAVMGDPAPAALFIGFGESSLNFELRCILPSLEGLVRVRHDLNMAIDRAFREAGIEIAFPQQDLHIRGIEGTMRIERAPRARAEPQGDRSEQVQDRPSISFVATGSRTDPTH
ncbi:MAG TPA: mechanosensitive ion channel [Phycisphaerales bacterium]|nr:mechanosensitive ion channel [Phycisphaerales bacterium]HMP35886.1 mechanosensitive ion channel [Phycisphaerales bacterium]